MCKFHKDVARDIATNEAGAFDAGKYSTALVAMALFRVEQYIPPCMAAMLCRACSSIPSPVSSRTQKPYLMQVFGRDSEGCVMCGHGSRALKLEL